MKELIIKKQFGPIRIIQVPDNASQFDIDKAYYEKPLTEEEKETIATEKRLFSKIEKIIENW